MTDLTTKDSNGNDLEKGVFYEIITMGRSIPPHLHLFQGFKGNDYLFETHKGQKTFPIVTIDSLIRYSQEQLEDLVSDYKSLTSFIKQHPQTSPKYTAPVNSDGPKGTYAGFAPLGGALKR
ncbi:hypothetical protein KAT24_00275 [Candidatus Pacearchaeota archaeon]|nr:hypothetical protein [Candidatus Pacearchaeota archaeon]